jgi:hypothetical protein
MIAEAIAGLSIFTSLMDAAKGLKDINDATIRNGAVIDLQEKILAAQAQQTALVERIRELEEEVTGFKAWDAEKERYTPTDIGGGTFAYAFKKGMERGEPPHRLCVACYNKGQKGLLQGRGHDAFKRELVFCSGCKSELALGAKVAPKIGSARDTEADYF